MLQMNLKMSSLSFSTCLKLCEVLHHLQLFEISFFSTFRAHRRPDSPLKDVCNQFILSMFGYSRRTKKTCTKKTWL